MANKRAIEIKDALLGDIALGRYRREQRLPAERELALRFRASRNTVRQALEELERVGVVMRRGMSGTFVISQHPTDTDDSHQESMTLIEQPKASPWLTAIRRRVATDRRRAERDLHAGLLSSLVYELEPDGRKSRSPYDANEIGVNVISTDPLALISAPPHVAQGLGVPLHALVLRRYNVMLLTEDGFPAIMESYYPGEPLIDLMREGLDDAGLTRWVNMHLRPMVGDIKVDADMRRPTRLEQYYLRLSHLAHLWEVRYRTFDRDGHGLELTYAIRLGKPYQLKETLEIYHTGESALPRED